MWQLYKRNIAKPLHQIVSYRCQWEYILFKTKNCLYHKHLWRGEYTYFCFWRVLQLSFLPPSSEFPWRCIPFTEVSMVIDLLKLTHYPREPLFLCVSQSLNAGVGSSYFVGTLFGKSLSLNWTLLPTLICVWRICSLHLNVFPELTFL